LSREYVSKKESIST
ncbi:hypothetical protein CP09DC79_0833B, partial [Chlamydia psittaci 09DC79]